MNPRPQQGTPAYRILQRLLIVATTLAIPLLSVSSSSAAGLLVAEGGFGGVLEMKDHSVNVTINNGIAVTEVEQTFVNTEQRIVEALYTFPVPKKASVANFSMWINGKEMIGEVVEKERARKIYESYKQTRKDPGLLEQVDFKRFEMRIFPIAAGAEQRVRITYYQELDFDHDWANYVYPLSTTTRTSQQDSRTQSCSFRLDVKSEVPIVKMESPSHDATMAITSFEENLYRASLETAETQLNRDIVVAYQASRPTTGLDTIASKELGSDGFFQATLTVGDELAAAEKGMDYVFVLDCSGSMKNREKLSISQASIYSFISNLSPEDRFELITFNDIPKTHFGSLTSATVDNHAAAKDVLQTLQARGGTSLTPAIEAAYRFAESDRSLNVVLLSDGLTETNDALPLEEAIRTRPENCRVFAVGVGNDVNRPLLQRMAERAGGLAAFLSRGDNFERQAAAFRRKLTRPAIENVKLAFAGSVYDVEPIERANIYHGSPLRFYGRYKDAGPKATGPTNITLTGTIMGAPFEKTVAIELPSQDDNNPEIERMWASYRVNRLIEPAKHRNNSVARDEVVTLCEQFSIVSEYASFIVLENDAEYQRWDIERRNVARSSRDRSAQLRVNEQLNLLRERAMANLGPNAPADPDAAKKQQTERIADTTPPQQSSSVPAARNAGGSPPRRRRGVDLNISSGSSGGGGGGGAFDPITGLLALGLGGLGWAQRRKKK